MRSWITRAIVVCLISTGVVAIVVSPANASYTECNSGYVCIWYNDNGGGTRYEAYANPGTCHTALSGSPANDQANSFRNRLTNGKHVQFYNGTNCNGTLLLDSNRFGGPHAVNAQNNFHYGLIGVQFIDHKNKASSIFFNTG